MRWVYNPPLTAVLAQELDAYRQRLQKLREENELLRQSAHMFGELAERLAGELRAVHARVERGEPAKNVSSTAACSHTVTSAGDITRHR